MNDFGEYQWRAIAVLGVGGMDHGINEIAVCGGEVMVIPPLDLLDRFRGLPTCEGGGKNG